MRKSIYTRGNVYLFSIVPHSLHSKMECVSVSDYLTEGCRYADLLYWMGSFRAGMNQVAHTRITHTRNQVFVTDLSWAIIHAALLVFGVTEIDRYLEDIFNAVHHNTQAKTTFRLFVCSSHVIARVSKTVPHFDTSEGKHLFLKCFGTILSATSLDEACRYWKMMVLIFTSTYMDDTIRRLVDRIDHESVDIKSFSQYPEEWNVENVKHTGLRENSPFKALFAKVMEDAKMCAPVGSGNPNRFYNPESIEFLLNLWLPIYGLWGASVLQGTGHHYLTNAKVESWFA